MHPIRDDHFDASVGMGKTGEMREAAWGGGLLRRSREPTDQKKFACRLRSQFSLQYRVRYARQVFPSFERRDPKRTCLLTCGPFLLARGTPELALYIRLWRAYNDLRAHPTEKP